ncbi:hypothetical protein COCCADRAFT_26585 [Bipolaris zeicola 26-R-13]|uniref:Heterokaryon incompatibility domain-containing protein n=1 Tax=Cochliobolus carbonum (strain 26-R-13) TaxID=930089 RepID=W6Y5Q2_COCC2|nr:uncharacterized protein COCCADRAFT_26585 [Bipolaris zeicola 26-R-13]EUC33005.1 hypothetical protein COCCADRAFT_26585 [Bipolaris zeicola 26-R-13]
MDHFQYEPLDANSNHIRLLRFSAEPGSQPSYTLHEFDLNECPPYEALSYTWGPPLPTRIITLNQRPFEIRENLADFLDRMRTGITLLDKHDCPLPHPKFLWIDQLCINQASEKEKSHQVRRMAEIYKQAQRVIVWLGRGGEQSGRVMRLIADTWFADELPAENIPPNSPPNLPRVGLWSALHNEHRDYLDRLLKDRHIVENLLQQAYWNRLWVVQEFVLARDIVLACGSCAVTPAAIERLRSISFLPAAFRYRQDYFITIPEPLIALLRNFYMRKCEDQRDRVYGLLALCNEKVDIVVDYSRPMDAVFREVFTTLIYFKGYEEEWFVQLAKDMGVKQKRPAPNGRWH